MQAVVSRTVSPYRAVMAPLACFAIFPVSRVRVRPPTSTVTRCGAGVCVFSDMKHSFGSASERSIFRRVRGGNGPCVYVGRNAAIHEEELEARSTVRLTKRDGRHHEKFRH